MKDERDRQRPGDDDPRARSEFPAEPRVAPAPRRNVPPPNAVPVFVFGLVGLTVCGLCGIVAWVLGDRYLAACRAEGSPPETLGVVGRILGIVSTALFALGVVFVVVMILFGALRS